MRIPANLIKTNYTAGKEYMYISSYKEYKGYYYEIRNKFFTGKTYSSNSKELVKIELKNINTLLTQASTYTYGLLSKTKINNVKVKGVIPPDAHNVNIDIINFYCKKINTNPVLIKQISEQTYSSLKNDPLYIITYIGNYKGNSQTANDAYKQIPELRDWLLSDQIF